MFIEITCLTIVSTVYEKGRGRDTQESNKVGSNCNQRSDAYTFGKKEFKQLMAMEVYSMLESTT